MTLDLELEDSVGEAKTNDLNVCKLIQVTDSFVHDGSNVDQLIITNCGEQLGESRVQYLGTEGNCASSPRGECKSLPGLRNPTQSVDCENGPTTPIGMLKSSQEERVDVRKHVNTDSQIVPDKNPAFLGEPILTQVTKQNVDCQKYSLVKSPVLPQINEAFPHHITSSLPQLTVKPSTPTNSPPGLVKSPHWSPPRLELAVAEDDDMVISSCAPSEVVHSPPRLELALTDTPEARMSVSEEGDGGGDKMRLCHVALDRVDVSATPAECGMMMQAE